MNSFQRVVANYGVNEQSTNREDALLHALLVYASTDYEGADVETNVVRECLRRLEARGVGAIALGIVKQRLNTLEVAYDAGAIR